MPRETLPSALSLVPRYLLLLESSTCRICTFVIFRPTLPTEKTYPVRFSTPFGHNVIEKYLEYLSPYLPYYMYACSWYGWHTVRLPSYVPLMRLVGRHHGSLWRLTRPRFARDQLNMLRLCTAHQDRAFQSLALAGSNYLETTRTIPHLQCFARLMILLYLSWVFCYHGCLPRLSEERHITT